MAIRVNKSRGNEVDRACGIYGGDEKYKQVLVGTPEENTPLGRPRLRWKDNIKRDIKEVGREVVD